MLRGVLQRSNPVRRVRQKKCDKRATASYDLSYNRLLPAREPAILLSGRDRQIFPLKKLSHVNRTEMRRRSGSFTFPHYKVPRRVKQPDYAKWKAVDIGMTREEVINLLGRPRRDPYSSPNPRKEDTYYYYGYLELPMMPHVRTYQFYVGFNSQGRVFTKADPFGGVFSPDGIPSKPMIFTPPSEASFGHYPRIVDMRWHPVSGQYPIWYEVEIGHGREMDGPFTDQVIESELPFPYFVATFVGDQPGRFRVRGQNALGVGEWSEYRYFDFTPQPPSLG